MNRIKNFKQINQEVTLGKKLLSDITNIKKIKQFINKDHKIIDKKAFINYVKSHVNGKNIDIDKEYENLKHDVWLRLSKMGIANHPSEDIKYIGEQYENFDTIFNKLKPKFKELGVEVLQDLAGEQKNISNINIYDKIIGNLDDVENGKAEQSYYLICRFTYNYKGISLPLKIYSDGFIVHTGYEYQPEDWITPSTSDFKNLYIKVDEFVISFNVDITGYDDEIYGAKLDNVNSRLEEKSIKKLINL